MKIKRLKILLILLFLLGIISIGYATLSANLTINGTAEVSANTWNVHFANIKTTTGSVTPTVVPTLIGDSTTTSFTVTLGTPGDFYEFTIDIVNEGSIDAMINTITPGSLTEAQEKYLDYTFTYSDGVTISKNDLLSSGSTETIKVRIEFKRDITSSDLPSSDISVSLDPTINYIQNDNGNKIYHIGDYFKIGTEGFYIISNDGTNVKAITEYNLEAGNNCLWYDEYYSYDCTSITSPSGLQNSNALGFTLANYKTSGNYATLSYSKTSYWTELAGQSSDITNSENYLYPYLISYNEKIKDLGGKINNISLISIDELKKLGCDISNYNCNSAPEWVYKTSYWTLTVGGESVIWEVISDGRIGPDKYNSSAGYGIRPVITLLKIDI